MWSSAAGRGRAVLACHPDRRQQQAPPPPGPRCPAFADVAAIAQGGEAPAPRGSRHHVPGVTLTAEGGGGTTFPPQEPRGAPPLEGYRCVALLCTRVAGHATQPQTFTSFATPVSSSALQQSLSYKRCTARRRAASAHYHGGCLGAPPPSGGCPA